jgi:hypothetical protein
MTASAVFVVLALLCMLGVVASFFRGMVAMTRGQEKDHKTSNKMMQRRVYFQGFALLFFLLAYLTK